MGDQHIIGRLAMTFAPSFNGVLRRPRRTWHATILAATAGYLFAAACVAAPRPYEMRTPAAIGMHDGANPVRTGSIARPTAAPVRAARHGTGDPARTAHDSAVHAAARAKARYPYRPDASSDTAKALGMTDSELASWLTDIRQQTAEPTFHPQQRGAAELHPMHPAPATDS
ncbi:hypothetical protein [Burkholderia cenocepacia]|uniref:hypothetical protein n=2 Tax=Burkholderia TaxID=32008 RepID=UPI0018DE1FB0|nr:hypothetical protein [Burkholderia cenocepacia]